MPALLDAYAVAAFLWGVPAVLAARLALRRPGGVRRAWVVVALACAVIVIDKVIDVQTPAFAAGKDWFRTHAPELLRGGLRQDARAAILAALFVAGCAGLWLLVGHGVRRSGPVRLAFAGLVGVMGLLGIRLVSGLGDALGPALVELTCAGLVWGGAIAALRRGET